MEKKKPVGPRFYWNLTFSTSVYCRSNVESLSGWSIFLCHLRENECSEQVSENFRNSKIFVGKNYSSVIIFVGKYFRHWTKNWSLFTDKVFTDKVLLINGKQFMDTAICVVCSFPFCYASNKEGNLTPIKMLR